MISRAWGWGDFKIFFLSSIKKLIKIPLPCKIPIFCFCSILFYVCFLVNDRNMYRRRITGRWRKNIRFDFPFHPTLHTFNMYASYPDGCLFKIAHFLLPTTTNITPSKKERNVKYLIKMRWLKNGKLLCFSFSFFFSPFCCSQWSIFVRKFTSILYFVVEDLVKVWEDEKVCDIIEVLLGID